MDNNKNILNFSKKLIKKSLTEENLSIKNFDGFDYIKTEKDLNGSPFIKENLTEYANKCTYMVQVMREKNGKIILYNYYVPQDKLCRFLLKFENSEYDGKVIEIEKYIPEDLA